jgi:hypothetical protein
MVVVVQLAANTHKDCASDTLSHAHAHRATQTTHTAHLTFTSWSPRPRPRGSCTPLPAMSSVSPFIVTGGTTTSDMPSIVGTVSRLPRVLLCLCVGWVRGCGCGCGWKWGLLKHVVGSATATLRQGLSNTTHAPATHSECTQTDSAHTHPQPRPPHDTHVPSSASESFSLAE